MSVDWNLAGAVILSGLILVFVVLILLIIVVEISSKLSKTTAPSPASKPAAPAPAPVAQTPTPVAVTAAPAPNAAGEHIAAISAAVAAIMEEESPGTAYTITSVTNVQRTHSTRPVWGFAGMQHNTRPF